MFFRYNSFLSIVALVIVTCGTLAQAQQSSSVRARIAGLESNSEYMQLLTQEDSLSQREDSLMVIVMGNRSKIKGSTPEEQRVLATTIRTLEDNLFGIRAQKSGIVSRINNIEQQWVISNLKSQKPTTQTTETPEVNKDDAHAISKSKAARETLTEDDLSNLSRAEEISKGIIITAATYSNNYQELARLSEEYNQAERKAAADSILVEYAKTDSINRFVAKDLSTKWSFIYDNKSYAYAMLMEHAKANDAFAKQEELIEQANTEIAKYDPQTDAHELLNYHMRQLSMAEYEVIVAKKLALVNIVDSLTNVRDSLRLVEFSYPKLNIRERLFIDYEDIKFSTKPHYTAHNPIPNGKVYDKGTIYRINVGTFRARQAAALFRGAYPICIIKEDGGLSYYIGGYKEYEEAKEARELLLKRGFRRPEIVEWRDGVMRNLTTDPRPEPTGFRVELDGESQLTESVESIIKESRHELSRIAERRYVVGVIDNRESADSLANAIKSVVPTSMTVEIISVE